MLGIYPGSAQRKVKIPLLQGPIGALVTNDCCITLRASMATLQASGFPPYVEPCSPGRIVNITSLSANTAATWQIVYVLNLDHFLLITNIQKNKLEHDLSNKITCPPRLIETSLSAWMRQQDSDQTWRMARLIQVFDGQAQVTLLVLSCSS